MSIRPLQVFIAAAVCIAATLGTDASAAEASAIATMHDREPFKFTYAFDSEALQSARGTQRLYRNLILKAQRACSLDKSSLRDVHNLDRRCAEALVDNVVVQIGSPALAALHSKGAATNSLAAASSR